MKYQILPLYNDENKQITRSYPGDKVEFLGVYEFIDNPVLGEWKHIRDFKTYDLALQWLIKKNRAIKLPDLMKIIEER